MRRKKTRIESPLEWQMTAVPVKQPELVLSAPHSTRVGRMDEVQAARKPILRWKPFPKGS
ncbi:MAG: hypothetical protein HY651_10660 [Acidobacteria bacterium]|nr:hypothetical protein [Acidobacteriota bacterium]